MLCCQQLQVICLHIDFVQSRHNCVSKIISLKNNPWMLNNGIRGIVSTVKTWRSSLFFIKDVAIKSCEDESRRESFWRRKSSVKANAAAKIKCKLAMPKYSKLFNKQSEVIAQFSCKRTLMSLSYIDYVEIVRSIKNIENVHNLITIVTLKINYITLHNCVFSL